VVLQVAFPCLLAAEMACLQVVIRHCLEVERGKGAFPEGHHPYVEEGRVACSGAFHRGPEAYRLAGGKAAFH